MLPAKRSAARPITNITARSTSRKSQPLPTNQGPRYAAYLFNNTVVWSDKPLAPGEIYAR